MNRKAALLSDHNCTVPASVEAIALVQRGQELLTLDIHQFHVESLGAYHYRHEGRVWASDCKLVPLAPVSA